MTIQITMLVPPWHPFDSLPGLQASGLSGPGRLLQGHFLQMNPLALGNEGCLNGHKHPKPHHSAHQLSAPYPQAQAPAPAQAYVYPAPNSWQG